MGNLESIDWEGLAINCRGNVESMAGNVLASRKTIERLFRTKWRMSPARRAKQILLGKAMSLVRQGYSNKAIISDPNLCSESWLRREFKKTYGATP